MGLILRVRLKILHTDNVKIAVWAAVSLGFGFGLSGSGITAYAQEVHVAPLPKYSEVVIDVGSQASWEMNNISEDLEAIQPTASWEMSDISKDLEVIQPTQTIHDTYSRPFGYGYRVTSPFGYRQNPTGDGVEFHIGVDWGMPIGSKLYAFADGVVRSAMVTSNGSLEVTVDTGVMDNGQSYTYSYHHMNGFEVSAGQEVKAGDLIGYSGNTGRSTGPHLHFDIFDNTTGQYVDPQWVETLD